MAFPNETVTDTLVGMGPIIVGWDTGVSAGRVIDFAIETKRGTYEHMGGGNLEQIVSVIETRRGTGRIRITVDEIKDLDAATYIGNVTNAYLKQAYPNDAAKMASMTAAKAHVNVTEVKGTRNGQPTTVVLEITPYNAVGTPPWAFDNQATAA